jgi:hypothetical protein
MVSRLAERIVEVVRTLAANVAVGKLVYTDARGRARRVDEVHSAARAWRDALVGLGHCGPPGRTARFGAETL